MALPLLAVWISDPGTVRGGGWRGQDGRRNLGDDARRVQATDGIQRAPRGRVDPVVAVEIRDDMCLVAEAVVRPDVALERLALLLAVRRRDLRADGVGVGSRLRRARRGRQSRRGRQRIPLVDDPAR